MGEAPVDDRRDVAARDVDVEPVAWREAGGTAGSAGSAVVPAAFLHGLGGSRTAWEPQLAALSAARRCLAWDMPGYGASTPLPSMTFAALADAAAEWLCSTGAAPSHVLGLSMGGMIAQHLALAHPDVVRSLVLLDSSPAFGFDGTTDPQEWVDHRLRPLWAGATLATVAPEVITAIVAPGTGPDVVAGATGAMARIAPAGFEQAVRCLPTHDLRGRLDAITAPTLVIVGQLDTETPLSYSRYLADVLPNARLAVIEGAGHLSNLERPELVNACIAEFLEEHD